MLRPWATVARLVMAGIDEARPSDWVRTASSKGLADRGVLVGHILPHALLPVISVLGVSVSGALGAALVIEVIFAIPGTSALLYESVISRDIPTVRRRCSFRCRSR